MNDGAAKSRCPGCGVELDPIDGPVHAYMTSSAACFQLFANVLAAEYEDAALMQTHRLTVDSYAVQHPGQEQTRQQIQSVGLHLARLHVQLTAPRPPLETNNVMLGFAEHKSTLVYLEPPVRFTMTIADVEPYAGGPDHAAMVRAWASATWQDWSHQHAYIKDWVARYGSVSSFS